MAKGTLYIVSAASGAGKTTLVEAVVKSVPDVVVSVSHTTREKRPGEQDGVNYHFVSNEAFAGMVKQGDFLEHANVFSNHYGTSRQHIQEQLLLGKDVILEIDWQGARQIRQLMSDCRSVFILPPTVASLEERLEGRAQDSEDIIQRRMSQAVSEMSHFGEFDYIVINDDFEQAAKEFAAIFISNRMLRERQLQKHADLIAELLASHI